MDHVEAAVKIEESKFRIYHLCWLAALLQDELEGEFEEVFEDLDLEEINRIFGLDLNDEEGQVPLAIYELADVLRENRKFGFFAHIRIPRQHFSSATESSWSWSKCYVLSVYGETIEEVMLNAEDLAREQEENDRQSYWRHMATV